MIPTKISQNQIGLALSGGGVRAIAFHAGVLRWLAENKLLDKIGHVSSVSGGSLFTGLMFQGSANQWPTSDQYIDHTLPYIRKLLTSHSLQSNALCRLLLNPVNWRFISSRANVLAKSIECSWGISVTLDQLPHYPIWSINGTTAESGRRFRFKGAEIGDYEIGYADAGNFKLAAAMAVSAAFPGGIGPLMINAARYQWRKREQWNVTKPLEVINPKYETLHLYDGGVYDNLGLEPLFDIGQQIPKNNTDESVDFLIVSDAGAPFSRGIIPGPFNPGRLKRVVDIAFDQARSLRVRSFVNFLQKNSKSGMYLQIGSNPVSCINRYAKTCDIQKLTNEYHWLSAKGISIAVAYKTTLTRMRESDFDLLARHGYETALWNESVFLRIDG